MNRLLRILGLCVTFALVGCRSPAPVRPINPVGPRLGAPGTLVKFYDGAGATVAKYRVSQNSMRIYDAQSNRVGRIHRDASGLVVSRRDGSQACKITRVNSSCTIECAGLAPFAVLRDEIGVTLRGATGSVVVRPEFDAATAAAAGSSPPMRKFSAQFGGQRLSADAELGQVLVTVDEVATAHASGQVVPEAVLGYFLIDRLASSTPLPADDSQLLRGAAVFCANQRSF